MSDYITPGGGKMRPLCLDCRYYYVTWDKAFPHGCRVMGFKSKAAPCLVARDASGLECLSFAAKAGKVERDSLRER